MQIEVKANHFCTPSLEIFHTQKNICRKLHEQHTEHFTIKTFPHYHISRYYSELYTSYYVLLNAGASAVRNLWHVGA